MNTFENIKIEHLLQRSKHFIFHIRWRWRVAYKNGCFCSPLLNILVISLYIFDRHVYKVNAGIKMYKNVCSPMLHIWVISFEQIWKWNLVHSINFVSFQIFWLYLVGIYITYRQCAACKYGCSLLLSLSVISLEQILMMKPCSLYNFVSLWYILIIFGWYIYRVKRMCHM